MDFVTTLYNNVWICYLSHLKLKFYSFTTDNNLINGNKNN